MMQDREQKQRALKYAVSKGWVPQLEVDVCSPLDIQNKNIKITDLDVLAYIPCDFISYKKIIIDCKTLKGQSPINRALWLNGIMKYMSAEMGICILRKDNIEKDHRISAGQIGVTLLTEHDFKVFCDATSQKALTLTDANLGKIDLWEKYFDIGKKYPTLSELISFSRSSFWMIKDAGESCRKSLILLRKNAPELDPKKEEHLSLVLDYSSLFLISIAEIVNKIFSLYLHPDKKEDLSDALLMLLYGGRETYEYKNNLYEEALKNARPSSDLGEQLSLPHWGKFIELIRHALEAPFEINSSPLILRELAWSILSNDKERKCLKLFTKTNRQATKFAFLFTEYMIHSSRLPPDFSKIILEELMSLQ